MPTKSHLFWIFLFLIIEFIDAKIERPLLLIPGFAASMLHAYNKHNITEAPIRVFETFQDSQFKLENYLLLKYCQDCLVPESINPKYEIRAPLHRNAGLYGIDELNPDGYGPKRPYFHEMIQFLQKELSYEQGKNLFAFPYDWRLNSTFHLPNLFEYIKTICNNASSTQIDVISHSYGGIIFKEMLIHFPDTAQYIHTYISIGTPWKGLGMMFLASLFVGENLNNRDWNVKTVRAMELASPSIYEIISKQYYSQLNYENEPTFSYIMNGKSITLNIKETFSLLNDLLANNTYNSNGYSYKIPFNMKRILDSKADNNRFLMDNDEKLFDIQPRYVYNIVGFMINTSISAVIQGEINNYNEIVTNRSLLWANIVSGDGVAPLISANNSGFITLLTTHKQLNHNNLVRNGMVFEDLRQFLGYSCSFEGNWTLSLVNSTRNQNLTVRVYTDYQTTYSPMFKMKGVVMSNVWQGSGENFTFHLVQSNNCENLTGTWNYSSFNNNLFVIGFRNQGNECFRDQYCYIKNGNGSRKCIFGYLAKNCFIVNCKNGYRMTIGQPISPSNCQLMNQSSFFGIIFKISIIIGVLVIFSILFVLLLKYIYNRMTNDNSEVYSRLLQ